jgi:hypothetical protein
MCSLLSSLIEARWLLSHHAKRATLVAAGNRKGKRCTKAAIGPTIEKP